MWFRDATVTKQPATCHQILIQTLLNSEQNIWYTCRVLSVKVRNDWVNCVLWAPLGIWRKGWRAFKENGLATEFKVWPFRSQLPVCEADSSMFWTYGFQSDRLALGPHLTRGAWCCFKSWGANWQPLRKTYFNYHKSLGFFPFIQFFNGLCMYHHTARSFLFSGVVFQSVYSLCVWVPACVFVYSPLCGDMCVCVMITCKRFQLLSLMYLWPRGCRVLVKSMKTKSSKAHNCWGSLCWDHMNCSDIDKPTKNTH